MPNKFVVASSCFEDCDLRLEAEMLARRRRATRREVAMLAVVVESLKSCKGKVSFKDG